MRKVPFGNISSNKFNLLVVGIGLTSEAIDQLKRATQMGINLYSSSKLAAELAKRGVKVAAHSFDQHIVGNSLGYPKSGLPTMVTEGLTVLDREQLDMLEGEEKIVIHGVFTPFEEVIETKQKDAVIYNITDALMKGAECGRITMTRSQQLQQLMDVFEQSSYEITPENYEALATYNAMSTWTVIQRYSKKVVADLKAKFEAAKEVLANIGIGVEEAVGA